MSEIIDKLIDDILELVIGDMCCHHEEDRDEDGHYTSVEYSFNNEVELRSKLVVILKKEVTEEWIEEKAKRLFTKLGHGCFTLSHLTNFIRSLVEEIVE